MIGGAAMIQGHIEIADGVTVSASTMVMHSLRKKGVYTAIFPIDEHAELGKERSHAAQPVCPPASACAPWRRPKRKIETAMLMDIHQIIKKLPHRYPFLLVDRVLEFEKDVRIKALKNVTINEPFFNGHFPNRPVMPGVLMLEALAQASALLSFASEGETVRRLAAVLLRGHRRRALQARRSSRATS